MVDNIIRNVLVIEDNELNREILCAILAPKYRVIEAENGKEGLEALNEYKQNISLILLDIQMSVMNGYEFLEALQKMPSCSNIPIIVTTSSTDIADEIRCLELGASDFVTKPYKSDVVLRRVASMIRLSEASTVISRIEFDELTGLYNRDFFFINAERLLDAYPETDYDMLCCDIKAFRMISGRLGAAKADELLVKMSDAIKSDFTEHCIGGRIGNDIFAMLVPHREHSEHERTVENIVAAVKTSPAPNAVVVFGLYQSVDRDLSILQMFDNAMMAVDEIKHQYGKRLADFDESKKQRLLYEQTILSDMENALAEGQFEVYYQPKHDLMGNVTGGAEALVRWIHPVFGFMNPGAFIPLFEKTGFITQVDYFVFESVCRDLREWIDAGKKPVPISTNISRADFSDPELVDKLKTTYAKYGLPAGLLHIEVTESAYISSPDTAIKALADLQALGFPIELDDFGAGYSSLTALNELTLDVLKLDMTLTRHATSGRQKVVLEHILAIARSLELKTVAEGVETEDQVKELVGMGCDYAQGYYYAKPLNKKQFEKYLFGNEGV